MTALKIVIAALSLAVFAVSASACGGDDDGSSGGTTQTSTQAGGNDQLCTAASDLESSVTAVKGLDDNSSAADVESALTGVADAGKELTSAVGAGVQTDVSGLQDSVQDLETALKAVPSSASKQEALQQVESDADTVAQEAQSVSESVGCD